MLLSSGSAARRPGLRNPDMAENPASRAVGVAFVQAIELRDFDRLEAVLAPAIRFRALVPSSCRRASCAADTRRMIEGWFAGCERVDVESMHVCDIADRLHVGYRLRVHDPGGCYLLEQQGYGDVAEGRLTSLSLVCSGFLPADEVPPR